MYIPNDYGLYHMGGNVAEFVWPNPTDPDYQDGKMLFTKGGSFFDPPHYMKCSVRQPYAADSSSKCTRGFRPAIRVYFAEY